MDQAVAKGSVPVQKRIPVLHVTTAHQPYDTRIFYKEVVPLSSLGFRVDLATTVPNPQKVKEVAFIPLGSKQAARRGRIARNFRAASAMAQSDYKICHIHDPELLIAAVPALLLGRRIIYDVHEFYYDRIIESDWIHPLLTSFVARLYRFLEKTLLPHFAGIVTVTEEMHMNYVQDFGSTTPVVLVRNYPFITDEAISRAFAEGPPMKVPYIVHTGGASRLHAFDVVVAVAERLREMGANIPIVILGPIDLSAYDRHVQHELTQRAEKTGIKFIGTVSYDQLLRWVAHARIGYVLRTEKINSARALPTKLFEYFRFGVPVVACR